MSVVLTVKVEGLIRPPLAQMASTKACYKLGLRSNSLLGRPKMYPIYIENVVTVLYIIKTLHIYKALSTCMYCINSFLE